MSPLWLVKSAGWVDAAGALLIAVHANDKPGLPMLEEFL